MYRKDIGRSLQEKWIVSLRKEWEKRIAAEMSRQAKVGDVPSKKQALLTLERRHIFDERALTVAELDEAVGRQVPIRACNSA